MSTPCQQPSAQAKGHPYSAPDPAFDRRSLLVATAVVAAGGLVAAPAIARRTQRPVFIARNQRYDGPLERTIEDGLKSLGLSPAEFKGKRVLLKPNLVEPSRRAPQMTTHPTMVVAAAEVFRRWGATVRVGEGPGHVRDTELSLVEAGMLDPLAQAKLEYVDLNYEEVGLVTNAGRVSPLKEMYFPQSVIEADFIVSMPKLKTHHWVGMTASMKNLYGVMPGNMYGWPKNVLHHAGIPQTVIDINATLNRTLAIVDAIDCMEGDGPIMGSLKRMGLVGIGANLPALDATLARIMGLLPERINYLSLAPGRLGPIDDRSIEQRGESWQPLVSPFSILNYDYLQELRNPAAVKTS